MSKDELNRVSDSCATVGAIAAANHPDTSASVALLVMRLLDGPPVGLAAHWRTGMLADVRGMRARVGADGAAVLDAVEMRLTAVSTDSTPA
jgi:hypothetical protein